ncbi:RNA polymerase sigma factor [Chitinophaga japonensis]|uniref:RNA polymerase sigma-70 factor (ECF subfamily) n=1 Tax=Chitinophaga japonensis TaxID=104662 RepID=A0A562T0A6_CHIJA|nr:sigma-70 family RNA polymerase sigma factor [Chitinophaga japonensis]TWI86969.1 RNA polymerase sigma-70 factor (ECF subfamily) [Chitinophaga japonensis]
MFHLGKSLNAEVTLVDSLQAGGAERRIAEKKLYEHFFYFISQGARKYHLPEDECASAYSDTMLSVIEHIINGRFEGRSSLKSYAYQIFMNKCVDLVRKKTTNKSSVHDTEVIDLLVTALPDRARTVIQQLVDKSDRWLMMQKLREIGEKCQQLLLLFEDGYSDREIALQMQYQSPEVVKTTRLRCLEKLREKVKPIRR